MSHYGKQCELPPCPHSGSGEAGFIVRRVPPVLSLPPDLAAAKNWLRLNFEKERSTIFVADTGSKLIGFTQLYPALCSVDLVKYFVLYDLYVVEGARRQGIARLLMNAASAWAKRQGAARLDLETARDNAAGQTLYRSLGYKLDEVFLKFSLDLTEPL